MKENNQVIAEFMEVHITPLGLRRNVLVKSYLLQELKYHTSWDWLMPVVEKIAKHEYEDGDFAYPRTFGMPSDSRKYLVRFNRCSVYESDTLITATYNAVIDFIEMYNIRQNDN